MNTHTHKIDYFVITKKQQKEYISIQDKYSKKSKAGQGHGNDQNQFLH